jgi:hypothetical protein
MLIIAPKSKVRRMRAGDSFLKASRCGMRGPTWSWHEAQYFPYTSPPEAWAARAGEAAKAPAAATAHAHIAREGKAEGRDRIIAASLLDGMRYLAVELTGRTL